MAIPIRRVSWVKFIPPVEFVYLYLTQQEIERAFKLALEDAMLSILERLDALIELFAEMQPPAMWIFNYLSRLDFDLLW